MSKTIELSLTIEVHETKSHPPFEAVFHVQGKEPSGKKWENTLRAVGKSEHDAIDTVCRNNLLPKAIKAIAMVVSQPTPSYTQEKKPAPEKKVPDSDFDREVFYEEIRANVLTMKFTEIRAFVKEQGLSVKFANMVPRPEIGEKIITALQEKEKADA